MTTRWTSITYGLLGLTICGLISMGFAAQAQLDSDADLTAGAGDGSPPAASAPTSAAAPGTSSMPTSTAGAPAGSPQLGAHPTTTASGKPAGSGKRTSIDFEDELIEGQTQKPELFYLLQKRQFNYKRMIRLRDNFLPEMRKTAEEIQRKGSGD